jgi:hypothetical protein
MGEIPVRKISELLGTFLDKDICEKATQTSAIFKSWKLVVGSRLAAHSRIVDIESNFVVVETEHPAWIQLLQMQEENIVRFMKANYPQFEIRGVLFRVTGQSNLIKPKKDDAEAAPKGPEEAPPSHSTEAIKDDKLKAALDRLKQAYSERKKDPPA